MPTIKVYNEDSGSWQNLSVPGAEGIKVSDDTLKIKRGSSVEAVMKSMDSDLDTLKGNVAWLAKYGGGGSGGGGGSTVEAEILVNGLPTNNNVNIGAEGLSIRVQSKSSSLRWDITITVGGTQKLIKTVTGATETSISLNEWKEKVGRSSSMNVTAYNASTLTTAYWNGNVNIASVEISAINPAPISFETFESAVIQFNYALGSAGMYKVGVKLPTSIEYLDYDTGIQYTTLEGDYNIELGRLPEEIKSTFTAGQNRLNVRMSSIQDPTVYGETMFTITMVASQPVIVCNALSAESAYPTEVYYFGETVTVVAPFTAFSSGGQIFTYRIDYKRGSGAWVLGQYGRACNYNELQNNASILIGSITGPENYTIRIVVRDALSFMEYSKDYYVRLKEPDSSLLKNDHDVYTSFGSELKTDKLLDIVTYNSSIVDSKIWTNWGTSEFPASSSADILNPNAKSAEITSDTGALRLQNGCYIRHIESFPQTTIQSLNGFTLEICYRCDYHPDDERTILQWGSPKNMSISTGLPNQGIMIRDHDLYIGPERVLTLEDEEIIDIAITFVVKSSEEKNVGRCFVYVDGVIEAVKEVETKQIIPGFETYYSGTGLYVGASTISLGESEEVGNYVDMDLFRLTFYNRCLSPFSILIDHLNNEAISHCTNRIPDTERIVDGMKRNFIEKNDGGILSGSRLYIWEPGKEGGNNYQNYGVSGSLTDTFSVSNFVDVSGLRTDLSNFSVPLPLVYVDVSNDWTWESFIAPGSSIGAATGRFQYYDQKTKATVGTGSLGCQVTIQGTSTLADYIKNINIDFGTDSLFSPRKTWFPEQKYTLKADIVDSSHSMNTSIGRFVNTELGLSETYTSKYYPYSEKVLESFRTSASLPVRTQSFPEVTLKHGVEGFPCFLILRFADGIRSLGVYQFILGRESPRNLGYEMPTEFRLKVNGQTETNPDLSNQYPLMFDATSKPDDGFFSVAQNKGFWIEFMESEGFSNNVDLQGSTDATFRAGTWTGPFWQTGPEYYTARAEIKYNNTGEFSGNVGDVTPFMNFVGTLQKFPVNFKRYSTAGSDSVISEGSGDSSDYDVYRWDTNTGQWVRGTGRIATTSFNSDAISALMESARVSSFARYFCIMMFFGCLDNFMKNMPIKSFKSNSGDYEQPILGIYDTDTAAGQDNQAEEKVDESLWICGLTNDVPITEADTTTSGGKHYYNGSEVQLDVATGLWHYVEEGVMGAIAYKTTNNFLERKALASDNTTIVGTSNKLWYIDHPVIHKYYRGGGSGASEAGSIWTNAWRDLMSVVKPKAEAEGVNVAEYFYNNYFLPQTEGCGELLFNLTYMSKYINMYKTGTGSLTNQIGKLHGRRKYQVKRWLNGRLTFLNSLFGALGVCDQTPWTPDPDTVSINAAVGPSLSVRTNAPTMLSYSNQGGNTSVLFCKKNIDSDIYFGASVIDTSDYAKSHTLSNASQIIKLGKGTNPLYNVGFSKVNTGTLPYLSDYDVSAPNRSSANWNGLSPMDTNYMQGYFTRQMPGGGVRSELRNIDFRNTMPVGSGGYVLNLRNGFDKLQTLYINNSCITGLTFPEGVSLRDFNVAGSNLIELNIDGQNYVTSLNLQNCRSLSTVNILNCQSLTGLSLDSTNESLTRVMVNNCIAFKNLTITNNRKVESVQISCGNLEDVTITDCTSLQEINIDSNNLKTLTLKGCTRLQRIVFGTGVNSSLVKIDCSNTIVKYIGGSDSNIADLSMCTGLTNVNFGNDTAVQYIKFANIESSPINLTNSFQGCNDLERIYGHVKLNNTSGALGAGTFHGCTKFSIHGTGVTTWKGKTVKIGSGDTAKYKTPFDALNKEYSTITKSDLFVSGTGEVTNISLASTAALNYAFHSTSCTSFDVYYIMNTFACTSGLTAGGLSYTFYALQEPLWNGENGNNPDRNMFWGCSKITSFSYTFTTGPIYLEGPEVNASGVVTKNNGIFSPLTDLVSYGYFSTGAINCSKYLFRRVNDEPYNKFTTFSTQGYGMIFSSDDLGRANCKASWTQAEIQAFEINHPGCLGDFTDFFKNLPKLTTLYNTLNPIVIRFDTITLPSTIKSVNVSLAATYSVGNIVLQSIFCRNGASAIEQITASFRSSNLLPGHSEDDRTVFVIHENMFGLNNEMQNLAYIGYHDTASYSGTEETTSFNGAGIKKIIYETDGETVATTFPYNIVSRLSKLTVFAGFFQNLQNTEFTATGTVQLPGDMFVNNTRLRNVACLFRDVKFPFSLTGNGFRNCTVNGLDNAYRMFYHEISTTDRSQITGEIPYGLFYHGSTRVTAQNIVATAWESHSYAYMEKIDSPILTSDVTESEGHYYYSGSEVFPWNRDSFLYVTGSALAAWDESGVESGSQGYYKVYHDVTCSVYKNDKLYYTGSIQSLDNVVMKKANGPASLHASASNPAEDPFFVYVSARGRYEEQPDADGVIAGAPSGSTEGYVSERYTLTYDKPNQKLKNLQQCFYGCIDLTAYTSIVEPTSEDINPDYIPAKYNFKQSGVLWSRIGRTEEKFNKPYLGYWKYNGDPSSLSGIEHIEDYLYLERQDIRSSGAGQLYYMAAPDLLRYCVNNNATNVTGLFENCGINFITTRGGWGLEEEGFYGRGIVGRICPYLMKNLDAVTNYSRMFKYCRRLYSYEYTSAEGVPYLIPEEFFIYGKGATTLQQTFQGMSFLPGNSLAGLNGLPVQNNLDIRGLLAASIYQRQQGSTELITISDLFSNKQVRLCSAAFSNCDISITSNEEVYGGVQMNGDPTHAHIKAINENSYIQFENNFNYTGGKVTVNPSKIYYLYYRYGTLTGCTASEAYFPAGFLETNNNFR